MCTHCVWCGSDWTKKNGHHQNGKQNYRCLHCGRQFVEDAHHISDSQKQMVRNLLLERISLCGICRSVGVSLSWLLWFMKKEMSRVADHLEARVFVSDDEAEVMALEVDELWTFVANKAHAQWVWLVLNKCTRQILAYHIGDRSRASLKALLQKLPEPLKKSSVPHRLFFSL